MFQRTRTYADGTVNDADADTFSGEETMKRTGIIILLLVMLLAVPALADPNGNGNNGNGNNGNGDGCGQEGCLPVDVDVNNYLDVNNYNTNKNYNFNDNDNYNFNLNNNFNFVDQKQTQVQRQTQLQYQTQDQKQKQDQSQYQIVSIPQDDTGIKISNANKPVSVSQLEVGVAAVSRLVYPGEVLPYKVSAGDMVSLRSASDVGFYTIGVSHDDITRINSAESVPEYDPVYHKFYFGTVIPVDKVDYWTTRGTLTASSNAQYVVVDNRAPRNGYTHIELTITPGMIFTYSEPPAVVPVLKPDVYPTDEYGRAITG